MDSIHVKLTVHCAVSVSVCSHSDTTVCECAIDSVVLVCSAVSTRTFPLQDVDALVPVAARRPSDRAALALRCALVH